jgi:beta-glucanase (GH16 family)
MTLVWADEFDGTALNTADWTFETGMSINGWGNHELEYYRPENVDYVRVSQQTTNNSL